MSKIQNYVNQFRRLAQDPEMIQKLADYQPPKPRPPFTEQAWDNYVLNQRAAVLLAWAIATYHEAMTPAAAAEIVENVENIGTHPGESVTGSQPDACPACGETAWRGETWCDNCGAVWNDIGLLVSPPIDELQ